MILQCKHSFIINNMGVATCLRCDKVLMASVVASPHPCKSCGGNVKWTDDKPSFPFCRSCGKYGHDVINETSLRPSWDATWMEIAQTIAKRSYDPTLQVGAIIVSEDNTRMLSVGYNGNAATLPNERESQEPGKGGFIHAEVNALIKSDYNFSKKKVMYVTHSPCRDCCKLIVNAGISKVVYGIEYRDTTGLEILRQCGITFVRHT